MSNKLAPSPVNSRWSEYKHCCFSTTKKKRDTETEQILKKNKSRERNE